MNAVEFLSKLPCPPELSAIQTAVDELKELELLDEDENVTPLGRTLSEFQLEPKLSKALVNSVIFQCVTPVTDIITLFSSETEMFAMALMEKENIRKMKYNISRDSDHVSLMRLFENWLEYVGDGELDEADMFCRRYNLLSYKLETLRKLREIHFNYLHKGLHGIVPLSDNFSTNNELVKGVLLSGVGTFLFHRNWDLVKGRLKTANVLLTRNNHKATIAPESVNFKRKEYPTHLMMYINETRSNIRRTTIVRETSLMQPLTVLLFQNNSLMLEEIPKSRYSRYINSDDQVILKLEHTNVEFICDKKQAVLIQKCRDALKAWVQYQILHMVNDIIMESAVSKSWRRILEILNKILRDGKQA